MATTTISPNMNMPVPVVTQDPGPDWATNVNSCLSIIDSHNHTPGQGVQITPAGIDISSDLTMASNNLTNARSVRFTAQSAPIALAADIGCLYESGVDLYYNDGLGNQVRITQSGSVTGATGTITGLPSGTASASYSAGTFTFQGATNTPATMNVGPIITGAATALSKNVTISASGSQAANYALTLPLALPASTSLASIDSSGNMATVTTTGSGSAVLATSPTITTPAFSGVSTGTITGGTYSPTISWNLSNPASTTTSTWYYTTVANIVTVRGFLNITGGGSGSSLAGITIPTATGTLNVGGSSSYIYNTTTATAYSSYLARATPTTVAITVLSPTIGSGASATYSISFTYQIV